MPHGLVHFIIYIAFKKNTLTFDKFTMCLQKSAENIFEKISHCEKQLSISNILSSLLTRRFFTFYQSHVNV